MLAWGRAEVAGTYMEGPEIRLCGVEEKSLWKPPMKLWLLIGPNPLGKISQGHHHGGIRNGTDPGDKLWASSKVKGLGFPPRQTGDIWSTSDFTLDI